jgi:hypothetical protein
MKMTTKAVAAMSTQRAGKARLAYINAARKAVADAQRKGETPPQYMEVPASFAKKERTP